MLNESSLSRTPRTRLPSVVVTARNLDPSRNEQAAAEDLGQELGDNRAHHLRGHPAEAGHRAREPPDRLLVQPLEDRSGRLLVQQAERGRRGEGHLACSDEGAA